MSTRPTPPGPTLVPFAARGTRRPRRAGREAHIADFLQWDYIGAPCGRSAETYVANGGLALRSRQMMLDCLGLASPAENEPEDMFYTDKVRQLGGAMPDVRTAARFSVETAYVGHPFGVHGTDKYLHPLEVAERIVRAVEY